MEKKCKKCEYWRPLNCVFRDNQNLYCCHCLLDTGKRRVQVDGKCMSFKKREKVVMMIEEEEQSTALS